MGREEANHPGNHVDSIIDIIRTLRGEGGCPWDRKQTPETMWKCLVEEVFELLEAIETDKPSDICEEAGDVLFQLLFIIELYREKEYFSLLDAAAASKKKMIRRHPHVYQDTRLNSEAELYQRWETIKCQEKKEAGKSDNRSILDSVPKGLPPLLRAYKLSERASRAGFDWDSMDGVLGKVQEEWQEFNEALKNGEKDDIADEFGDILFTLVNVARFAGIHPDTSLSRSIRKFEKRFKAMEIELEAKGHSIGEVSMIEADRVWNQVKKKDDGT